jgi:hypothetical protein
MYFFQLLTEDPLIGFASVPHLTHFNYIATKLPALDLTQPEIGIVKLQGDSRHQTAFSLKKS